MTPAPAPRQALPFDAVLYLAFGGPEGLDQRERLVAALRHLDLVPLPLEEAPHHQAEVFFIVDHQDAAHGP